MFKRGSISTAVLACLGVYSGAVLAQQAPAPQQTLERVEVTGSRILSVNAESPAPIQVITAAEIGASGVANLQDLLLKNPVFGTPGISRTNSNFSTSSAGVATIDLRNLGSNRTLVLVNGRRYVSGVPGDSSVDLNSIPTDFIERVEVMTGGASSTYGSDAVAGVVNIILKRNFQGMILDAQVGESQEGDDRKRKFSATFGMNAPDNRGNLMFNLSASKQGAVYSRDRSFSAVDQYTLSGFTGEPADIFTPLRPFYSSFAPQGTFTFRDATLNANRSFTFDPNGNQIPVSTNGPNGDGVGATGYDRSAYRTIAIPTDRLMLATKGEFNLSDKHTVFFEGNYASTKTKTRLEPFALASTDILDSGFIPAENFVNGVRVRNPLVPDTIYNNALDRDGDGLKDFSFTRRMSDIALRGNKADRDTVRIIGGVKGEIGKNWNYDTYAGYGFTKEGQTGTGQVNVVNFRNALAVMQDVNDANNNGNTTEVICIDPVARAQGCVPANVFGANTLSPGAAAYLHAPSSLNTKTTQALAGFSLSGEPFELPAGPVGVALGAEYRRESSSTEFDALTQTGLNAGNALPNTAGSFNVKEVFLEGRFPLLKNLPAVKTLDATAAVRQGRYSSVGNTTSWNSGLDWGVNDTFRVRASYAVSTRAPNIGELFQAPSQTFPTGLIDPCQGVTAAEQSTRATRCLANPGVAANVAANGEFTLNQADAQGVSGFDSGNPNLKAEKGQSLTLGFVITPRDLVKNLSITTDYYRIKVKNAINTPGRQYALTQCYNGDASYCQYITRRPTDQGANSAGSLEFINETNANTGGDFVEGIDLTAAYATKLAGGQLNARLSYTYMRKAYNKPTPDAEIDRFDGEIGQPKNRWLLNLGYNIGPFGLSATTTYIGKSHLDDTFLNNPDLWVTIPTKSQASVKEKYYLDLQGSYSWGKSTQIYLGIDNALNTKPAPIISGLPGNVTGAETASIYDAIGRRYYIGLRYSL
ncbi:TonB-dependent receptor plug domain-containing protein [Roseateles amylovorans]|uniref:TonB-dependent receptor n=1 Tax=Roseateles amylovorans TaxID=2978473 RepID=A0ABY6B357_9BURK|nr:TonB-dependent receptor [Roseateles amylovorans]UXH77958.1 TonB-dependent receptor [Roseateles amylovorans]